MKKILLAVLLVISFCFAGIISQSTVVSAKPSCTQWTLQADGKTYWCECVNDDGSVHCYENQKGSKVVTTVKCGK